MHNEQFDLQLSTYKHNGQKKIKFKAITIVLQSYSQGGNQTEKEQSLTGE
jgi:hypothetical protein